VIATHMERLIFLPFFMVCKRSFFASPPVFPNGLTHSS